MQKCMSVVVWLLFLWGLLFITFPACSQVPVITSFAPQSGPIGTAVTITGTGFNTTANQNIVFFGTTRAAVTSASATSIAVNVPVGATYSYITVTNIANNLTTYAAKQFTVTTPGHIAYASKQDFGSGDEPVSAEVADFDGDGKTDLAVVNSGDLPISSNWSLAIFRNKGLQYCFYKRCHHLHVDATLRLDRSFYY
jgi:hypothetical protein